MKSLRSDKASSCQGDAAAVDASHGGSATGRFGKACGLLLVVAALALAAYPFLADLWGAYWAERQFSASYEYARACDSAEIEAAINAARVYNDMLVGEGDEDADGVVSYERQLDLDGTRVLTWLDIPKLGLKVPVYRISNGEDEPLMSGAGHIRGTSLPVGGASANTVITGHSGMRQMRMFDQIGSLGKGDVFILWTLGRPFAYEVTTTEVLTVSQANEVAAEIERGHDEATLVTCWPVGVNSHRLVVRASRTSDAAAGLIRADQNSERLMEPRFFMFVGALAGVAFLIWVGLVALARKRRDRS